ncbi:unnamed protein product [Mytilus edulis]|uniref:Uncharacterized protein n=1 Tax=Mytilus edulis TaxID=6550 RepID=A0A8S3S7B2_MYTED|nr:unnamed protein product [Mytilus edulis]
MWTSDNNRNQSSYKTVWTSDNRPPAIQHLITPNTYQTVGHLDNKPPTNQHQITTNQSTNHQAWTSDNRPPTIQHTKQCGLQITDHQPINIPNNHQPINIPNSVTSDTTNQKYQIGWTSDNRPPTNQHTKSVDSDNRPPTYQHQSVHLIIDHQPINIPNSVDI